jgi:hypothetical protein
LVSGDCTASVRSTTRSLKRWESRFQTRRPEVVAARLQVPLGSFHLDVDCLIDMDPEIMPEFRVEFDRRVVMPDRCAGRAGDPNPLERMLGGELRDEIYSGR